MAYQSPGGAFSNGLEQFMMQRAAQERQAMLDQRADEYKREELRQGAEALAEKRREHDETLNERERNDTLKDVAGMVPGDIPDADLLTRAKKHHITIRMAPPAPPLTQEPPDSLTGGVPATGPAPQGMNTPAQGPAPNSFLGTAQQQHELQTQRHRQSIADRLQTVQPGSKEERALLIEGAALEGRLPNAAELHMGGVGPDVKPATFEDYVIKTYGANPTAPQIAAARTQWAKAGQDTSGADAARADREAFHLDSLRKDAITELNNRAKPLESDIENASKLTSTLNQHTNTADAVVAEQLLKLTAGGQGSGLRLNNVLIDRILHGTRTKFGDLEMMLRKFGTDTTKSLIFNDEQRAAIRELTLDLEKKAHDKHKQLVAARYAINSAKDKDTIYKTSTDAADTLYDNANTDETAPTGLPTVGSMFNGAKVLAVRPK